MLVITFLYSKVQLSLLYEYEFTDSDIGEIVFSAQEPLV